MTKTIVIKMGGVASGNLSASFFSKIREWQSLDYRVVIVHGGGIYINQLMEALKIPIVVKNGLRVTTSEGLDATKMALIGKVQPEVTAHFKKEGINTVGLNAACSNLLVGEYVDKENYGHVGYLTNVNIDLLNDMLDKGYVPVVAPLGMTEDGQWLNVNGDSAACEVAAELEADKLYMLTDVPGIKAHGKWLEDMSEMDVHELKEEKIITGGMLPKVESGLYAINHGVNSVHITNCITCEGTAIVKKEVCA